MCRFSLGYFGFQTIQKHTCSGQSERVVTLTGVSSDGHVSEQTLHGGRPPLGFGPALRQEGPHLAAPGHAFPPLAWRVPVEHQEGGSGGSGAAAAHQLRQGQQQTSFLPRPRGQTLDMYVGVGEGQGIVGGGSRSRGGSRGQASGTTRAVGTAVVVAVAAGPPAGKLAMKEGFCCGGRGRLWRSHPQSSSGLYRGKRQSSTVERGLEQLLSVLQGKNAYP